jgi:hypothetical protein
MNCPIIKHLQEWHASLAMQQDFPSIESKAEHIGLLNRIETAIARLKLCEANDIYPGAWICVLPPKANPQVSQPFYPEYRIVCDRESDKPEHWEEVRFEKRGFVRLTAGDIVIKK